MGRRWGWRELLAEAIGVQPDDVDVSGEAVLDERAEAMLAGLRAARDELGRWPLRVERDEGGRRPASRTFVRHFGGWREACWAAEMSGIVLGDTGNARRPRGVGLEATPGPQPGLVERMFPTQTSCGWTAAAPKGPTP
jgi:Homing endonuclease associated repeat